MSTVFVAYGSHYGQQASTLQCVFESDFAGSQPGRGACTKPDVWDDAGFGHSDELRNIEVEDLSSLRAQLTPPPCEPTDNPL